MSTPSPSLRAWVVAGVCCSTEEHVLRKSLDPWLGPEGYSFNSVTGELITHVEVRDAELIAKLKRAGFDAKQKTGGTGDLSALLKHRDAVIAGIAALVMVTAIALVQLGSPEWLTRVMLLIAIVVGGWKVVLKAVAALRLRALDMNVLMTAAVCGALVIGRWEEGAAVIVLFAVALMLESYSTARTRHAVASLMAFSPAQAVVLEGEREHIHAARTVAPGSLIVIRPGERVPLDGVVTRGASTVDESPITGESEPAGKVAGNDVYAGSLNRQGMLVVRVTRPYDDTALARIVHSIQSAEKSRAPVQSVVDRIAGVYTPVVFAAALLVAVVPPLVLHAAFGEWFYRALVMLVIACPCALVISTPVTIVSALTGAARHGVLVKGGKHLQTLSAVRVIAFDKTGTLTEGRPRITDIIPLDSMSRSDAVRIVAALERYSDHHLSSALLAEASDLGPAEVHIDGFEALPGRGVCGVINGTMYFLGNEKLSAEKGFLQENVRSILSGLSAEGKTTMILGARGSALCVVAARDMARQQSRRVIAALRSCEVRHLAMLSGDHPAAVGRVADEVGLEWRRAGVLPHEKVESIRELRRMYGTVAMVGDGVNDGPALRAADVGIAMGVSGSDTALETADVVLMSDELMHLPAVIGLSRRAMQIIRQNIGFALLLKGIFLALSMAGIATLWMALLADDGAALIVILNGLRALSPPDIR